MFYQLVFTGNLEAPAPRSVLGANLSAGRGSAVYLWLSYTFMGDYEKAHAAAVESLKLNPASGNNVVSVAYAYQWTGQLDQAKAAVQESRARNVDSPWLPLLLYNVDFLLHDAAGMEKQVADATGKPGVDDQILFLQSETAAYNGQFAKSRDLRAELPIPRNEPMKKKPQPISGARRGPRCIGGRHGFCEERSAGRTRTGKHQTIRAAGGHCIRAGRRFRAGQRLAADLGKRFPDDTIQKFNYVPMIRAAIALHAGDGKRAIERFPHPPPMNWEKRILRLLSLFIPFICGARRTWRKAGRRSCW